MRGARVIRDEAGLSLIKVVRKTTIDGSNLSKFEQGKVGLSIDKLIELTDLYSETLGRRVTVDDLIREVEPSQPQA